MISESSVAQGQSRAVNLYPGCSLGASAKEMAESYLALVSLLGLELRELEDWSCCGSTAAHSLDDKLAILLPARNLLLAEEKGVEELVSLCPSCHVRLWDCRKRVLESPQDWLLVKERWGRELRGLTKPVFFLAHLLEGFLGAFKDLGKTSLKGLKVAPYYGCLLSRQIWITGIDGHGPRGTLWELLQTMGSEPLRWGMEEQCCGAGLAVTKPEFSQRLVEKIHQYARRAGAQCLVVFCPLCHMNLELRAPRQTPLPILYVTELMCLATEIPDTQRWLAKHLLDPRPALRAQRII